MLAAVVVGRRFDFDLLQRLTGHDETTLLELIKSLIAAQLVVEESAETFAFRHALTREALYSDLLARELGSFFTQIAAGLLASVCVAQRDIVVAGELLSSGLDSNTAMETRGQRLAWCARAELELVIGDSTLALQIVDQLIATAANVAAYGEGCIPRLWHLRGMALASNDPIAAEAALLAADAGARARGLAPARWRIQASLGRLYQSQGQRKQADSAFATARAIVEELATAVPESELRAAFLRSTAAQILRPPAPTPRRATKSAYDGLTERERKIAALIARGRSNHEIAAALVL